ncbi:MAG TPA: class I SAM-dependent methyltransferase [Stenomitos sp.]
MTIQLPLGFAEIADEIQRFTDLSREDIERRLWLEALMSGYNVAQQGKQLGVTPHRFDETMERLYKEGDGFIFETMAFWSSPLRMSWIYQALGRIQQYAERQQRPLDDLSVLIFGDGSGNDSLYLASNGLKIDYFDIPGSKTYDFASRRFEHYGQLGRIIRLVTDYADCLERQYDVILSFEVLEHLTNPDQAIGEWSRMVKPGGIALVTESFAAVSGNLPTHLESNLRFDGQTPFMFLKHGLRLTWYNQAPLFKPYEFTKAEKTGWQDYLGLMRDRQVFGKYLVTRLNGSNRPS